MNEKGKINLISRERWTTELENKFMQYVYEIGEPNKDIRRLLISELYEYIDALEWETGGLDGVICMEAVRKSEKIKVISAYGKEITPRIFKTRCPRKVQVSNQKWDDQKKAMLLVSNSLGVKLTKEDLRDWIFFSFDYVGKKFSKEILGEYYMEDFHNQFVQSHKSFDDFIDYLKGINVKYLNFKSAELNSVLYKPSVTRIARDSENLNKNTFDFVDVTIPILSKVTKKEANEIIRRNIKEVLLSCFDVLNSDKQYSKYGIPTACLKVGKAVITNENTFIITFELKDYGRAMEITNLF